eukprot:6061-Heterococcus_DN1.PRE.2
MCSDSCLKDTLHLLLLLYNLAGKQCHQAADLCHLSLHLCTPRGVKSACASQPTVTSEMQCAVLHSSYTEQHTSVCHSTVATAHN